MAATRAATLRVTPFLRQGLQQTRPGPAGVDRVGRGGLAAYRVPGSRLTVGVV